MRILDRFAHTKLGTLRLRRAGFVLLPPLIAISFIVPLRTQAAQVPDWALPASSTHKQVPPPRDFHRSTKTFPGKIGIFGAQSDIGGPLVSGSATFDPATGTYIVNSAGYNIWYTRDEFRFLWKKMSGDISFAANVGFPVPQDPPRDRKVVMVIRQDLDDDSEEAMVAEHGSGMVHLAQRPEKGEMMGDMEYRIAGRSGPDSKLTVPMPQRIGIEKRGDEISLWVSISGEPMHQFGPPIQIHFKGPFYVGIGFCSHYPVTLDSGSFSHVVLENEAGRVH
jgi:hypothetical protein